MLKSLLLLPLVRLKLKILGIEISVPKSELTSSDENEFESESTKQNLIRPKYEGMAETESEDVDNELNFTDFDNQLIASLGAPTVPAKNRKRKRSRQSNQNAGKAK